MRKVVPMRALCLFLCLATLAWLCSCVQLGSGDEDTPEGMQIASAAGADFLLYVPTTWVLNTAYGISGAYRDLSRQSTVSMVKYPITSEWAAEMDPLGSATDGGVSARVTWFFETECLRSVRAMALDGLVTMDEANCGADVLDAVDAGCWCYSALVNGVTYHYKQLVLEKDSAFYVLTFTATEEMYEQYLSDVERILDAFRFTDEPYYPKDFAKELDGGEAPSGMKACFGGDVAYRFYVPSDWEIDLDSAIYAAYRTDDRSSVSMVPYMPTVEHLSVSEYFDMLKKQMESLYGVAAFRVDEDKTHKEDLGGREATVYEYTCIIGGVTYRFRQYIAAYRSMMYSLTYTATAECFDAHLSDVERMVQAFAFK